MDIGGLMNMKWVVDGIVKTGSFCVAQGFVKQLADVGTALSAGNVAIYTFSALIFRLKPDTNMFRASLIVAGIWFSIILTVAINVGINGSSNFYTPTGYWCWISDVYHVQRTVADFMWMWISAFSSLLAYVAVFLVLRGFITVERLRVRWTYGQESPDIPQSHILAYKMLAYPIVYIITVLPLTAARYRTFTGHHTPFAFTIVADGLFLSSGLLNVLLYAYTRPFLFPDTSDDGSDNQSIAMHSEYAQSHNDLPASTVLSNTPVVDRDPSLIEPKSAVSSYNAPEMAHNQPGTLPMTTHESLGQSLVRRGIPTVNISEEV